MDLTTALSFLREASPWAVFIGGILIFTRMFFAHREKRDRNELAGQTHDLVSEVHNMMTLNAESGRQTLQLLGKIAQELVTFNASQSGEIVSIENSKIMIENQWSWLRDETARIICNSVENNHFLGNEEMVARRARRAWKSAAGSARRVLGRINGLQYPYDALFERHLPFIWENTWEWAVPLYHRDLGSASISDALDDLKARVSLLFDDVIRTYFEMTEDIDRGKLYSGGESVNTRISQAEISIQGDELRAVSDMVKQLRAYDHETGSGQHRVLNTREEMERREQCDCDAYPPVSYAQD